MNTRQLTALWYTALLLAVCAVLIGLSAEKDIAFFAGIAVGVAILGLTLLYTLSDNPNAEPKRLWRTVALPLACIASVAGAVFVAYQVRMGMQRADSLKTDGIVERELPAGELAKLQATATLEDYGKLTCNIYNGSSWDVKDIIVHLDVPPDEHGPVTFDDLIPLRQPSPTQASSARPDTFDQVAPSEKPDVSAKAVASTQAPSVASPGTQTGHIVYDSPPLHILRDLRLTRDYSASLSPLSAADFTTLTGIENRSRSKWTWKIVSARGHPE